MIESNKARGVDPVSADLRFMEQPAPLPPTPAEHRKSTADAAKATGASSQAVALANK